MSYTLRMLQAIVHSCSDVVGCAPTSSFIISLQCAAESVRFKYHAIGFLFPAFPLSSIVQPLLSVCKSFLSRVKPCRKNLSKPHKFLEFRFSYSWIYKCPQNAFCAFWNDSKPCRGCFCDWLTLCSRNESYFFSLSEHRACPCAIFLQYREA